MFPLPCLRFLSALQASSHLRTSLASWAKLFILILNRRAGICILELSLIWVILQVFLNDRSMGYWIHSQRTKLMMYTTHQISRDPEEEVASLSLWHANQRAPKVKCFYYGFIGSCLRQRRQLKRQQPAEVARRNQVRMDVKRHPYLRTTNGSPDSAQALRK